MKATTATPLAMVLVALLIPVNARGYALRTNSGSAPLVWTSNQVDLIIDTRELGDVPGAVDAVRAAFVAWTSNGVPQRVNFIEADRPYPTAKDGHNVVRWEKQAWKYDESVVAMTVSWYKASSSVVYETDIVANAQHKSWGVDPAPGSGRYDVQNVLAHEAGHFFGMGHSELPDATMFRYTPAEQISKRALSSDDLQGIAALVTEIGQRGGPVSAAADEDAAHEISADELDALGGCSVAGGRGAGATGLLLPLLLGLLALRRRVGARSLSLLVALGCLVAATPARATLMSRLPSVQSLVRSVPTALVGRVVQQQARYQDGLIVTVHTVQVERCLRGSCGEQLALQTLGGVVGDVGMAVDGMPQLRTGMQLLLLGRREGNRLHPAGAVCGVLTVRGQVAVRDLRGLHQPGPRGLRSGGVERHALPRLVQQLQRQPVSATAAGQHN